MKQIEMVQRAMIAEDKYIKSLQEVNFFELKRIAKGKAIIAKRFMYWGYSYGVQVLSFIVEIGGKGYLVSDTPIDHATNRTLKVELYKMLKEQGIFIKDLFNVLERRN